MWESKNRNIKRTVYKFYEGTWLSKSVEYFIDKKKGIFKKFPINNYTESTQCISLIWNNHFFFLSLYFESKEFSFISSDIS